MKNTAYKNKAVDALLGVAIGDAVGVPYEFKMYPEMCKNPATDMIGYGTYMQPPGTWSDDSSLTFCLAESLISGYDLKDMASNFIAWKYQNYWTAHNELFDIGNTTSHSISALRSILAKGDISELTILKYQGSDRDNGNGSLMRIIPLLFYIKDKPIEAQFDIIWDVSALTHKHIRAAMSCLIYLRFALHLLNGFDKNAAYLKTQEEIKTFWQTSAFVAAEQRHFETIIQQDVRTIPYKDLRSGGYVIEALEASFWCFLQTDSYKDAILKGINKGHDTDTTAAITGGLAGIYYGKADIPDHWIKGLARLEDIIALGEKLGETYSD